MVRCIQVLQATDRRGTRSAAPHYPILGIFEERAADRQGFCPQHKAPERAHARLLRGSVNSAQYVSPFMPALLKRFRSGREDTTHYMVIGSASWRGH